MTSDTPKTSETIETSGTPFPIIGEHRIERDIRLDKLYKFYSTPDGENCLEKTYYYTKYSGIMGAVFSVYEMVLVSQPQTAYASIARFGRFTLPMAGCGATFGAMVCLSAHARKKSDLFNHLIAGAAAGAMWGVKYKSISTGYTMAVLGGLFGAYCKFFDDYNIPTFGMRTPEMRTNIPNMDFTIKLYDDPGRPDTA